MRRNNFKNAGLVAIALAASTVAGTAHAAPQVQLNGAPLPTSVTPRIINGSTLVPMRDIFEALGATVNYDALTRGISAQRADVNIALQLGNRAATVNGQTVTLNQPPILRNNSTLVPLRFVSEALGAQVYWNNATQLVSITQEAAPPARPPRRAGNYPPSRGSSHDHSGPRSGTSVAGVRTISVPRDAVVPVKLDEDLSSATARRGDTFTTTVRSNAPGDSEFPQGTRIEGVVTEAARKDGDTPGALDVEFRNIILPSGERIPFRGSLISLDDNDVTTSRGRVTAKPGSNSNTGRNVLIGAGAGFVLGKVIGRNSTVTGALGGLAGYLLGRKNASKAGEAKISKGTELGVRLDQDVRYTDDAYADRRYNYMRG